MSNQEVVIQPLRVAETSWPIRSVEKSKNGTRKNTRNGNNDNNNELELLQNITLEYEN